MSRRAWVAAGVVVVLVLGGTAVWGLSRDRHGCGDAVTSLSAKRSSSPFLDAAGRKQQPDADRVRAVASHGSAPAPFGPVLGAVGYHYEQWAQISAYDQGIGIRTRDNPDFTMLDDRTLRPRWSVRVAARQSTYDASERTYLAATLPAGGAPELVALDADDGERRWCATLGERPVRGDDAFATAVLGGEDVAVLAAAGGTRERVWRLDGEDGSLGWERTLDADSGDFLGELGGGRLLVGGRAQSELYDAAALARRPAGVSLAILSERDGRTLWTAREDAGSDVHVVGADPGLGIAILSELRGPARSVRLRAIDRSGDQKWFAVPARGVAFDATVRAGRVLVRAGQRWSAYDVGSGRLLWSRSVPARPQFLPYGFELDRVPLLDDDHVLLGGTTALHTLDLRTGAMTSAALPTDGVATTYWPYDVVLTPRLLGVATNTGAVVVRRE